jgi:hypothetical protein
LKLKTGKDLICCVCNKTYYVQAYRVHKSKYCSLHCMNRGQYPALEKECPRCKIKFRVPKSKFRQKYCSMDCSKGNSYDIKAARKKQRLLQRARRGHNTSRQYRKIAFAFKEKKCESCGYDEYDFCLDVHHLDQNPHNNKIENLVVLCCICHRKLHKGKLSFAISQPEIDTLL